MLDITKLDTRDRLNLYAAIGVAIAGSLDGKEPYTVIRFLDNGTPGREFYAVSVRDLTTTRYAPHEVVTMGFHAVLGAAHGDISVANVNVPEPKPRDA